MSDPKQGGKGFSGLSGLSARGDSQPPATPPDSRAAAPAPAPPAPVAPQPRSRTATPKSRGPIIVLLVLAAVVLGSWLIGSSDTSGGASPSVRTPEQVDAVLHHHGPPVLPGLETAPGAGTDLILDDPQLRYCTREKIRLEGAKGVIDPRDTDSKHRFNQMVFDFNSRCSSFRYNEGSLEPIQRESEAMRTELEAQGARRFPQTGGGQVPGTAN